ncbi:endoplasmic reticulum membrane-associated RNA degradation protein [Lingula anatina]|uniref:Endoplasmic reticulum membrane-associated RNA degradation protein n=1 Tax=Lingula anatina TaxID=7574 RepID=A0A1S3HLU3_LINAN|nr:endoplasmic reticulum membrane-associated RNA degradation protein [Lingula anatina]|eukprot:XP_013386987.1 endoplasmic reticulum membrane-associated RNA degradation protein [Lingula anatina]
MADSVTSFLSPHVRHILSCGDNTDSREDTPSLLLQNGLLCWMSIENHLPDGADSPDYFTSCVQCLAGVFRRVEEELTSWTEGHWRERVGNNLTWTGCPQVFLRSFEVLQSRTSTSAAVSLLMTTSALERALGDIFLLKGKQCPSMLKELLVSEELKNLLGGTAIKLLRILIGPPVSLNLRNVLWHGFAVPDEVPRCYAYFLVNLIPNLGQLLQERSVEAESIPHRVDVTFPQVEDWDIFPDITIKDCAVLEDLFNTSEFVPTPMLPYWADILESFNSQRYGEAVMVLLPQLEHCLRCLFARVNQCPERILTAESTTLYTTVDEMLAKSLPGGSENQLRYTLGDQYMDILFDVLIYPEGPRVRDRISHGEASILGISYKLANHLLSVCTALCLKVLAEAERSKYLEHPFIHDIHVAVEGYVSQCHPISGLRKEIQSLCDKLSEWKTFPKPDPDQIEMSKSWGDYIQPNEKQLTCVSGLPPIKDFQPWLTSCNLPERFLFPFEDVSPMLKDILKRKISTLYWGQDSRDTLNCDKETRPMTEMELVGLLRRIAVQATAVSTNIYEVMSTRYQQWIIRELRSRQRKNYIRLLESIPTLSVGLRLVAMVITVWLLNLDAFNLLGSSEQLHMARHLKSVLQCCENLTSNCNIEKNRWEESCILVQDLAWQVLEKKNLVYTFL